MVLSIFTSAKHFGDPWVGHAGLNRMGLHGARVRGAHAMAAFRRWQSVRANTPAERELLANGVVAIRNVLPEREFRELHAEVRARLAQARAETPYPAPDASGFGQPQHHEWGFDRFDGGTLNRFVKRGPLAEEFAQLPRLRRLSRIVTGRAHDWQDGWIYETLAGAEDSAPDIQAAFHRDTFFGAMKYWYYLEPVTKADGPLVYVPQSHLLTRKRIDWEARRAAAAMAAKGAGDPSGTSGSFRVAEEDIAALGLPDPVHFTVPANTLVVANIFGFHRRGEAEPGSRRLSLYGYHRRRPFQLIGR